MHKKNNRQEQANLLEYDMGNRAKNNGVKGQFGQS